MSDDKKPVARVRKQVRYFVELPVVSGEYEEFGEISHDADLGELAWKPDAENNPTFTAADLRAIADEIDRIKADS